MFKQADCQWAVTGLEVDQGIGRRLDLGAGHALDPKTGHAVVHGADLCTGPRNR